MVRRHRLFDTKKQLFGINLLQAIKAELENAFESQEVSEMDLFLAAQQLVLAP